MMTVPKVVAELVAKVPQPWRRHVQLTMLGGMVAVVAAAAVIPPWRFVQGRRQAWIEARAQILNAKALEARNPSAEAREALQRRYDELAARVGAGQSIARIVELLGDQARAESLEVVVQQAKDQQDEEQPAAWPGALSVAPMPLTLQLTGRYRALGEFVGWLAEAPFVATVDSIRMDKLDPGSPRLKVELRVVVYPSAGHVK
jgi:Tfp pilus assembly protein PilO